MDEIKNEGIEDIPLVMDTKFASIAGMCYDEVAKKLNSFIVIDIGIRINIYRKFYNHKAH